MLLRQVGSCLLVPEDLETLINFYIFNTLHFLTFSIQPTKFTNPNRLEHVSYNTLMLGIISYVFRHQGAIVRDLNNMFYDVSCSILFSAFCRLNYIL